jgi:hypothetical protein
LDQLPSESIGELLSRLVGDARESIRAEVGLYRAQILNWIARVAAFGVITLMLVNAAIIALIVGLLLIAQCNVGPIWATVIVVVGTLICAALFGWLALRQLRGLIAKRMPK